MADLPFEISTELLDKIEEHCFSETLVEVGGFLFGQVIDGRGQIEGFMPALRAVQAHTHLTFGHDSWEDAYQALATDFPGQQIVGWYHTHPDFGCFLSDYDEFIQANFFSGKGLVALVIDPIRGQRAWFEHENGATVELLAEPTSKKPKVGSKAEAISLAHAATSKSRNRVFGVVGVVLIVALGAVITTNFAQNSVIDAKMQATADQKARDAELIDSLSTKIDDLQSKLDEIVSEDGSVVAIVSYKVKRGDSLWTLARYFLGDGSRYPELLSWNPGLTEQLYVGQTVNIHLETKAGDAN